MRKIILGLGISLDGYIARPNGSVDFLFMPKDYSMGPFFETVDAAILGRKTYEDAVKMSGEKAFAGQKMNFYVCTRTLPPGARDSVVFTSETPGELTARIRKESGKNIWLMGGGELAREFLKADLVDELYLGIVPILIGEGRPLFPSGFPERKFDLLENKSYSKGMIGLKYARARKKSSGSKKAKRAARWSCPVPFLKFWRTRSAVYWAAPIMYVPLQVNFILPSEPPEVSLQVPDPLIAFILPVPPVI